MDALRSSVYGVLALALRRPGPAQVGALAGPAQDVLLGELPGRLPVPLRTWPEELGRLADDVRQRGAEAVARALLLEYGRLFLGPGPLPCPPYGSLYLDGVLMGPSALEALRLYREHGLAVPESWREPADHIAVELSFMAHLSAATQKAITRKGVTEAERLLESQEMFLDRHLGRWAPLLADRLAATARGHLYRFVAAFLPSWLALDGELVRARVRGHRTVVTCG
jgi:TorA maturation chaperone TorD